jgi:sugar lactone lactonase YvrE
MRRWRSAWLVLLLSALVACGAPTPPTGSLSIAITGLPAGVAAAVLVSGPGGYAQSVSESRVLADLAPGSYTLTAATVDDGDPVVPALYDATVATAAVDVVANGTAIAAVTHAWRVPTGRLWLSRDNPDGAALAGYDAAQLIEDGAPEPVVTIGNEPQLWAGIAFDAGGNAWVARYFPTRVIVRFRAGDLATSGARVADVVLSSAALDVLNGPVGLAFDASGALWVSGKNSDTIVKYAPEQLASSGAPSPQVVLRANTGSLADPGALAFDASGALWVANAGNDSVVKFTPTQLATSGSPTPAVTLTGTVGTLSRPIGLAFDAGGSLWVATLTGAGVLRYRPEQLLASGSPTPSATLTGFWRQLSLAFDHAGDLWVRVDVEEGAFVVRIADPDSLTMSSEAVVATAIELEFGANGGYPTFFPPPPGLPIRTP